MNKEEVIEAIKKISDDLLEVRFVSLESVIDIVSQIHEPQKVVVPKFVAEWIKKYRHAHTLLRVLNASEKEQITPSTVNDWILDNQYDFIKAWLEGYEVEKEPLYTVEIPNPNSAGGKLVLFKQQSTGRLILDMLNPNINKPKYRDWETEQEIRKDFDWAFRWAKEVEE